MKLGHRSKDHNQQAASSINANQTTPHYLCSFSVLSTRHFQPGEGTSRDFFQDYKIFAKVRCEL